MNLFLEYHFAIKLDVYNLRRESCFRLIENRQPRFNLFRGSPRRYLSSIVFSMFWPRAPCCDELKLMYGTEIMKINEHIALFFDKLEMIKKLSF